MNIDLSKHDVDFITLLLERELKTVMVERHHTVTSDYKEIVKEEESHIEKLLGQFKSIH